MLGWLMRALCPINWAIPLTAGWSEQDNDCRLFVPAYGDPFMCELCWEPYETHTDHARHAGETPWRVE